MYGYSHKKHHKKHSSSSSSSSSSSDDEPWKKEQKRQKKLMKKMQKGKIPHGTHITAQVVYPGAPRPGAPRPQAYPQAPAPGYGPQPGYPQQQPYAQYPPQQAPGYPAQPQAYPAAQYPPPGGAAPQAPAFVAPPPGQPQQYPGQPYPQGQYPPPQGGQYPQQPYPGGPGYPSQPGFPAAPAAAPYPGAAPAAAPYPGAAPVAPAPAGPPPAAQLYPAQAPSQPPQPSAPLPQHSHTPAQPQQPPSGTDRVVADLQKLKLGLAATGTLERVHGTISAAPNFSADKDAEILRKAMKGAGTDEKAIISVIGNRSNQQRQQIKAAFKTMYGKDLIKDMKSELSGDLEEMTLALFMPTTYYDAWSLQKAMRGAGTKESVLIEILCTRTNAEIREINATYRQQFGKELEKEIAKETSGHFERLLISALQGNRAELSDDQLMRLSQHGADSVIDRSQAQEDAKALYKAGEGKVGTDESTFLRVFASRNFYQLRAVFQEYEKIKGRSIIKAIEKEMSGDLERGFKAVAKSVINRPEYFAEKLRKAMKGAGTDESTLIRVIVSRSEIDLATVKEEYQKNYGKPLAQAVKSETRGDFEKLLLALVK